MTKSKNTSEQISADQALKVYGPPQFKNKDIVDLVCGIMDEDGPRPMRGMRPSEKHRTGAEQFDSEHQGAYEARGCNSRKDDAVSLYNSGYPKMHDELAKRRSTAKITATTTRRNSTYHQSGYSDCNNYIKKKKVEPKRKSSAPKCRENKRNSRSRQTKRITKAKSRRRRLSACRIYRYSKIRTNRGCQCSTFFTAKDKKSGTIDSDSFNVQLEDKMAVNQNYQQRDLHKNCLDISKHSSNTSECSKNDSKKNPDSNPSVSSYNSYASMDHEPMVSE